MTKQELIEGLKRLQGLINSKVARSEANDLLLLFIGDIEITKEFNKVH